MLNDEPPADELTPEEQRLIDKHLPFYRSLASGQRKPTTAKQAHFVAVCQNNARPLTEHEHAYMKYLRSLEPASPPTNTRELDLSEAPEWCSREGVKRMRGGLYGDMRKRHRDD